MKKYLLYGLSLLALAACVEEAEQEKTYTSKIEPAFTIVTETERVIEGDIVSFTNESKVEGTEIEHCFWHFGFDGNGNWQDTMTPEPVQYKYAGEYTVTLTIKGTDGNSVSTTRQLVVNKKNVVPKADFTYTWEGNTIKLTDTSVDEDGTITSWDWTILDGTVEKKFTEQNPTYTFSGGGKKQVSLTVSDEIGATASVSKIVFLIAPVTDFTINWSLKVEEPTDNNDDDGAEDRFAVVTVAENESKVFFGTTMGNLYSIADNYFDAKATKVLEAGKNRFLTVPSYENGIVYWIHKGKMHAVNAATDQVIWEDGSAFDHTSTNRRTSPIVSPHRIIITGANGPGTHLRAYAKDGSGSIGVNAPRGGAQGPAIMLKNGLGWASINRACASYFRPVEEEQTILTGRLYDYNKKGTNMVMPCVDSKSRVYYTINQYQDANANKMICLDMSNTAMYSGHITATMDPNPMVWEVKWADDEAIQDGGLTLSADESTLYFALNDKLYFINTSDGQKYAEVTLPGISTSVPAVDNNGSIHLVTKDGHYVVVGADRTIKYDQVLASELAGSVSIASSGVSYVAGMKEDGWYVFAISIPGVTGPANSPWAQFGQNPGHTMYQK